MAKSISAVTRSIIVFYYQHIYYMLDLDSCEKKSVVRHEMGHAHGLAHSYNPNVMTTASYPCVTGSHDSTDYNVLW